jgi:hypothetical protein
MKIDCAAWTRDHGWSTALPEPDDRSAVVVALGSTRRAGAPVDAIHSITDRWKGHAVVGCSGLGTFSARGVDDDSLQVHVVRLDRGHARAAGVEIRREGTARRAARRVARELLSDDLVGIIVIADTGGPGAVNVTEIGRGFADVVPHVPVVGGLAAGAIHSERAWAIADGTATTGWITAVGVFGQDIDFAVGSSSGWEPCGPEQLVTKAHGNVVYELDGFSAAAEYARRADAIGCSRPHILPLAFSDLDGRTTLRTVVHDDAPGGALVFAGDVPQGSTMRWTRTSCDSLVEAAGLAAKQASSGRDEFALGVSCSARRGVLGRRTAEEADVVSAALGTGSALAGFYGRGAIAPVDGECDLMNQTIAIATISERAPTQLP